MCIRDSYYGYSASQNTFNTQITSNPVSYTHLDVYKRQPLGSLNQGTPIGIYEDDKFIKKIDFSTLGNIPFTFSFYGKIYDSVLVSLSLIHI